MRSTKLIFTLVLILTTAAFAFGQTPSPSPSPTPSPSASPKPSDYVPVNGFENWDFTYDVSKLPRGMYNIIVQGVDKAGNVFYSNPVNILIDPESDLPVASVTNPVADMRVGNAMLNIVGTCVDDDAVAKVEVQIDSGDFQTAEGTDFWSFKLQTAGMEDGRHIITVRGTDKNGTVGKSVTRAFVLDTRKPLNIVTSHAGGVLLSGSRDLDGTIEDLNGVVSLFSSVDNGKTFQPLGFSYKAEEKKYYFRINIDTTRLADGPNVVWFKSTDGAGSVGVSAFLFFVDNKKPALEFLAPAPGDKMNGKFYVVGRVQDEVGIKSLVYQYKDKKGDIPLIPGNPYWFVEIDASAAGTGTESVKFTVTDITGNVVETEARIVIDSAADKPVVTIAWPKADSALGTSLDVYGFVDDDDQAESVVWQLDGKEPVTIPAKDGFTFPLTGLDPGKHTVTVYGIDVNKVQGDKASVTFTIPGTQSTIKIESVVAKGETTAFLPGVEIGRFDKAVLRGRVTQFEPFKKITYQIDSGKEQGLSLRGTSQKFQMEFDINLPETLPYGIVEIKINAIDSLERTTSFVSFIHVTNFTKISAKPGIFIFDTRIDSQPVCISEEFPFAAFFVGDKVKTFSLEPAIPQIRFTELDGRLILAPTGAIESATAKIRITTVTNESFTSDPISFTTTGAWFEDPLNKIRLVNIVTKTGSQLFSPGVPFASQDGQTKLEGTVASDASRLEFSFNNRDFRGVDYRRVKTDAMSAFSFVLPGNLSYGYNELFIRVSDEKNRAVVWKTFFFKIDPGASGKDDAGLYFLDARTLAGGEIALTQDNPFIGYVNGREIRSVTLRPASPFLKASANGNFVTIEAASEGKSGPTTVEVVTVNNQTYTSSAYVFLANAVPPQIAVSAPAPGDWVNKTFTITGTVSETTGVQSFEYAIGAPADWKRATLTAERGDIPFSLRIDVSDREDGQITVFLRAVDTGGNESVKAVVVKKDTAIPAISLITPEETVKVNGVFSVTGKTGDNGRIKALEFSSDGRTYVPMQGLPIFTYNLDITQFRVQPDKYYIRATDASGNVAIANPAFPIDFQADKPRVEIQIPGKGEVLRTDFLISGMAFDDDGVAAIYYRIDGRELVKIEGATNSFSLPIALADISDNEHKIEVVAEDLNGLRGDIASSTFFISKAEPVSALTAPTIDVTTRGEVQLAGTSSDANGIKAVYLSFDNGNTYHLAVGKDRWSYQFNTALLADGIHRLLIKAVDATDTEGLSATLINVDNTAPTLSLDRPVEGESVSDALFLNGRAFDNIQLVSLTVNISAVGTGGDAGQTFTLTSGGTGGVFSKTVDMTRSREGWYNIRIEARDKANNITYVTRNVRVEQKRVTNRVEQIFPQDGESVCGFFTLSGRVIAEIPVTSLSYAIDDKEAGALEIDANKYFSLNMGPDQMANGEHTITITAKLSDGSTVLSMRKRIIYSSKGPWVRIANFKTGDFISKRPWMKGEAGYALAQPSREDREAYTAYEREVHENRIERIEISFDNGKSFSDIGGGTSWSYRLQTQNIPDGEVRILIRATTASKMTAVTRLLVVNDDLAPNVRILLPEEQQRFNDKITVLGIAGDENGLSSVQIALRNGDKAAYVVPEFIQGMYIDGQFRTDFATAVAWSAGFGFAFFDQNVKLQAQVGFVPSERFGGLYLGAKLLANIFKLPFEAIFGPDADFLSLSLALGMNVSYCTNSQYEIAFTDKGLVLAAVLAQLEFPRFEIIGASAFNAYSFYTEFQVWLLSSDVVGAPVVEMRLSFGARIQLF